MTSKRKIVRRSFLAAVSGVGVLTLAACSSDPGDAGAGNGAAGNGAVGNNSSAPAAAPASDADRRSDAG